MLNRTWLRKLVFFVFPDGLVLLAAMAFLRPGGLPSWSGPLVEVYAYVVLIAALLLGWYARRSRVLFAVVLLVLADWALGPILEPEAQHALAGRSPQVLFQAVTLLLPLNLLGLSLINERTFAGVRELVVGGLIVLQIALVMWLSSPGHEEWASSLDPLLVDARYTQWTAIPQLSLLTLGLAIAFLTIRFGSSKNKIEKGTAWALFSCAVAFQTVHAGWSVTNYLSTAGLMFIMAVYAEMHRGAYYDELTAIPSRQALDQALFDPGKRYAIALVEVDRLKELNVEYGYTFRNEALRLVAKKCSAMSNLGKAFRFSGERFVVLYREKEVGEVLTELEALRNAVETCPLSVSKAPSPLGKPPSEARPTGGQVLPVTISIGLAGRDDKKPTPAEVLKAAEKLLLRAKRGGGNQLKAEHQADRLSGTALG